MFIGLWNSMFKNNSITAEDADALLIMEKNAEQILVKNMEIEINEKYKALKLNTMNTTEHTGTIDLTKPKSLIDCKLEFQYVEISNKETLSIELNVLLNNRGIGTIKRQDSKYNPYEFESLTPMVTTFADKSIVEIKTYLEKKITTLITFIKEWH